MVSCFGIFDSFFFLLRINSAQPACALVTIHPFTSDTRTVSELFLAYYLTQNINIHSRNRATDVNKVGFIVVAAAAMLMT